MGQEGAMCQYIMAAELGAQSTVLGASNESIGGLVFLWLVGAPCVSASLTNLTNQMHQ